MNTEEWYEYLRFTRRQQYILLFYFMLIIGMKCLGYFSIFPSYHSKIIETNLHKDSVIVSKDSINEIMINRNDQKSSKHFKKQNNHQKNIIKRNINKINKTFATLTDSSFRFDPNTISIDSIQSLNISPNAKKNWIKYRERGGYFHTKSAMLKIYGLNQNDQKYLLPRILFEKSKAKIKSKEIDVNIRINNATEEEWQMLRGIGPYFAKNIIKYKNDLGGFINIHQIAEVYRLPDSTFQAIKQNLILDEFKKSKNLNTISFEELFKHPYITYKQAKHIIKYRDQHGIFKKIEDLNKIYSLNDEFIKRIKPYFYTAVSADTSVDTLRIN